MFTYQAAFFRPFNSMEAEKKKVKKRIIPTLFIFHPYCDDWGSKSFNLLSNLKQQKHFTIRSLIKPIFARIKRFNRAQDQSFFTIVYKHLEKIIDF